MYIRRLTILVIIACICSIALGAYFISRESSFTRLSCKNQLSADLCGKIGQMLIIGFGGLNQDADGKIVWQDPDNIEVNPQSIIAKNIKQHNVGGIILFTYPFYHNVTGAMIRDRNIKNPKQLAKLTKNLQSYSSDDLPLFVAIDQEGGIVDRLPSYLGFNHKTASAQALGVKEDLVHTRQYADKMAMELYVNHFNVNFAPTLDVNINPLNPIIGAKERSFSADPEIVADQAWQFVQAFHAKGLLATLKHFPGHGSSEGDSHVGFVDVTDTYQRSEELLPYQILIKRGFQDFIMTTHVINGQIDKSQCKAGKKDDRTTWCPGTMSYVTLTELLRKQLGFKGVIVSDDMTMGAIVKEYPLDIALEKAINAGVNMFILANSKEDRTEEVINMIATLIKKGRVSEAKINQSYQYITQLKQRLKTSNGAH